MRTRVLEGPLTLVYVNGVPQHSEDWTWDGETLKFCEFPVRGGDQILIVELGGDSFRRIEMEFDRSENCEPGTEICPFGKVDSDDPYR